ncbi:MAG: translation initiation factor eIF-1A [Candidatus Aenigmarchaeota archaeon]|nr:translation initiation factor eIF-1A [Candidatus Aenigmarchaeota archaeon]
MYNQSDSEGQIRVRTPRQGEVLGVVEGMLGANKLRVRCQDDKIRICRIPGRLRKRVWVKEGDVILVEIWQIQGDKFGDVAWKYTPTQVLWLRKRNILTL